jgi:hypothetical protein
MTNYGETKADYKIVAGSQGILGFGSELYNVPMAEQKGDCEPMKITAKGGGVFDVDPSYTYQAIRGRGVDILFNFKALLIAEACVFICLAASAIELYSLIVNPYLLNCRIFLFTLFSINGMISLLCPTKCFH